MARQLSYRCGEMPFPLEYCTVPDMIYNRSITIPDTEAFVHHKLDKSRESITYKNLYQDSVKVARKLLASHVAKGDKVGLFGPNTIKRIVGDFGIMISGGVVVHISPTLKDASDVKDLLVAANVKCLIIDPGESDILYPIIDKILQQIDLGLMAECTTVLFLKHDKKYESYPTMDWTSSSDQDNTSLPVLYPEDPMAIFSTSGSTGHPKLVEHNHFIFVNQEIRNGIKEDKNVKVYFNDRPFGWAAGSPLLSVPVFQTRVFVDATLGLKGDFADTIWKIIVDEKCEYAMLMPYMLYDLISMKSNFVNTYKLKGILLTGQLINEALVHWATANISENVILAYGCTEAMFTTAADLVKDGDSLQSGCIGYPVRGMEIKVTDAEGHTLACEQIGEIYLRSGTLPRKYVQDDEASKRVFIESGWFKTGDMGYMSKEGQLVIKGRRGLRISRGTRKIYPEVLEYHISKMEGIKAVLVIPVPDKRLFEEICVCFVSTDTHNVQSKQVEEYCSKTFLDVNAVDGLGDKPKYYLRFDDLPKLSNGKPDRMTLKKIAEQKLSNCH